MNRKQALQDLDKLLLNCQRCEQRKVPFSPRSHEHRNSYCIKQCTDVGPKLRALGDVMEDITKTERADKRGKSA
ncbi:hypothetical protein D3C81_174310 [compost metagenome]